MCFPALNLLNGAVSAADALTSARAQSTQLRAQAKFAGQQADLERRKGAVEAARQRRAGQRALGARLAQFASAGVTPSGSPTDVLSNIRAENELDADRIRLGARTREDQLRFNAGLGRSRASAARTRGIFGTLSPIIGTLKSLSQPESGP